MWKNKLADKVNCKYGEIDFESAFAIYQDKLKKPLETISSQYTSTNEKNVTPIKTCRSKSPSNKFKSAPNKIENIYTKSINVNSSILSKQYEEFMKNERIRKQLIKK